MHAMLRSILLRKSGSKGRKGLQYLFPVSSENDSNDWPSTTGSCLFVQHRSLAKKGPGKRSQHALRRKEEIENYKKSPFGVDSRPAKQFDELKFYHARNKYGQKETLVDSRRRDIAFFDPVAGGFEKDPRSRYGDSGSDENLNDEEAALYADFTDTDDEDVYFGGGHDADGDFDDEGNELRPKARKKKQPWADAADPRLMVTEGESDPDEDEREFNEVFGERFDKLSDRRSPRTRNPRMDDRDVQMDRRGWGRPGDNRRGRERDQLYSEAAASGPRSNRAGNKRSKGAEEIDFSKPDPDLGISPVEFVQKFEKKKSEDVKSVMEKGFSADEFLKDEMSSDDDDDLGSDWDEDKMIQAGDEELEELEDVSDMIRDYDRPDEDIPSVPVTEQMAEEEREREMEAGEFYESDDVEVPHTEDPKMQQEINEEDEMNLKKLRSTPGGRKTLKALNAPNAWKDDFPERGRHLYENALKDAPHDGPPPPPPPPAAGKKAPSGAGKKGTKDKGQPEKQVHYVSKDDPKADLAKSKKTDSWRTLSLEFDADATEPDFLSDLKEDETERREQRAARDTHDRQNRLRGRPPYGGTGVRFYSTSCPPYGGTGVRFYSTSCPLFQQRNAPPIVTWQEEADQQIYTAKFVKVNRKRLDGAVNRATQLQYYWSRFPSDAQIQSQALVAQKNFKHSGTLYVAMTMKGMLLFGVSAPKGTFRGNTNVADQFVPAQDSATPTVIKVDLKRFRRMKQRGEILTGGPHIKGAVMETSCDWTGSEW